MKQIKLSLLADLPTSHMLVNDKGITGQVMHVINSMLIDLMATMARLDQEKRVERIKQGWRTNVPVARRSAAKAATRRSGRR